MNNNQELDQYIGENSTAKAKGIKNQPYSQLNNFIQYAIGDNISMFIDTDEKGNTTLANGLVRYGYNKNDKPIKGEANAIIVIKDAFDPSETEEAKIIQNELRNTIYKPISQIKEVPVNGKLKQTKFNILLKKTELYFVEALYNNFKGSVFNNTISVRDTELAKIFKTDRANLNRDMNKIIIALSQIQIRSFAWGKKMYSKRINGKKELMQNLAVVNLIQDAIHENGLTQITFNDKFAYHIGLCNPLQVPEELYQIKDALTFDIVLYLYGQVREKPKDTFKIKIKTLYDTIKQIPRYENVKNRRYQEEIYQPIEKAMQIVGSKTTYNEKTKKEIKGLGLIDINYENTDYINDRHNYDFNKWLDTNLVVKILKTTNLKTLRDKRQHYKKLADKYEENKKASKKSTKKTINNQINLIEQLETDQNKSNPIEQFKIYEDKQD